MVNELTHDQFTMTMGERMIDVTDTAEAIVDIWPYIAELNRKHLVVDYVLQEQLVERVYRNSENTFEHILLPSDKQDFFIVIVVNLVAKSIEGYSKLDLKKEYS